MTLSGRKLTSFASGAALAVMLASTAAPMAAGAIPGPVEDSRPNVVIVMTDDQDRRSLHVDSDGRSNMPYLLSFPEGGWQHYQSAYVNSAICTPSRASLLTGLYSSENYGITHNGSAKRAEFWAGQNTVPHYLQDAGVLTAKIGKNMNGVRKKYPVPGGSWRDDGGWDYYHNDYSNTIRLFEEAVEVIKEFAASDQPFYLELTPVAGKYAVKPSRDSDPGAVVLPPRTPDIGEEDTSDKPAIYHDLLGLFSNRQRQKKVESFAGKNRWRAYQTLQDADAGMEMLIEALKETGELENTIIIYTSDHGFGYGSHGIERKDVPYEEIIGVPMLVRLPQGGLNELRSEIVSTMDVIAGVLSVFGATATVPVSGDDMAVLWDGDPDNDTQWDNTILFGRQANPRDGKRGSNARPVNYVYDGVVTLHNGQRWKYIVYNNGQAEMYNLDTDPYELENLSGAPGYVHIEAELLQIVSAELGE